jgi:hypothetical protein
VPTEGDELHRAAPWALGALGFRGGLAVSSVATSEVGGDGLAAAKLREDVVDEVSGGADGYA